MVLRNQRSSLRRNTYKELQAVKPGLRNEEDSEGSAKPPLSGTTMMFAMHDVLSRSDARTAVCSATWQDIYHSLTYGRARRGSAGVADLNDIENNHSFIISQARSMVQTQRTVTNHETGKGDKDEANILLPSPQCHSCGYDGGKYAALSDFNQLNLTSICCRRGSSADGADILCLPDGWHEQGRFSHEEGRTLPASFVTNRNGGL